MVDVFFGAATGANVESSTHDSWYVGGETETCGPEETAGDVMDTDYSKISLKTSVSNYLEILNLSIEV